MAWTPGLSRPWKADPERLSTPSSTEHNMEKHFITLCNNLSHKAHSGLDGLIASLPSNEQWLRVINFKLIFISKNRKKTGRCSKGIKNNDNSGLWKTYIQISNPGQNFSPHQDSISATRSVLLGKLKLCVGKVHAFVFCC